VTTKVQMPSVTPVYRAVHEARNSLTGALLEIELAIEKSRCCVGDCDEVLTLLEQAYASLNHTMEHLASMNEQCVVCSKALISTKGSP
jgi:hypothetical protein